MDRFFNGYKVVEDLRDKNDGLSTYLAVNKDKDSKIVIKETCTPLSYLPTEESRRIEVLSHLEDSRIVSYLGNCKQGRRYYLIRRYVEASSLVDFRGLQPEIIRAIAISLLETLVMLQNQIPLIIHGNIKPENIFLMQASSEKIEIVLVDFAVSLSGHYVSLFEQPESRVLGFTSPEQMAGHPNQASDNYAVGAVLLSLLSGTPAHNMAALTFGDNPYRYRVREILSQQNQTVSSSFIVWLEQMLEPDPHDRFPDARTALYALLRLSITARPRANLNPSVIHLQAERLGEQLHCCINVSNLMPGTVLSGQWRVGSLLYDSGNWIHFDPGHLVGNKMTILLTVDTRELQAKTTYERELVFQSNSEQPIMAIPLFVSTAHLTLPSKPLPVLRLTGLLIISGFLPIVLKIVISA